MGLAETIRRATQQAVGKVSAPVTITRPDGSEADQVVPAVQARWSDFLIAQGVVGDTDLKIIVADADTQWAPKQLDRVTLTDGQLGVIERVRRIPFQDQNAGYILQVRV